MAAVPRAALRWRFPGRVGAVLRRPADSCCPGLTPAQEHRCAAVGKAVMSAPVSAMMMSATLRLTPGILVSRSRGACRELIFFDPLLEVLDCRVVLVDSVQQKPGHEGVVLGETAGQGFGQVGSAHLQPTSEQ